MTRPKPQATGMISNMVFRASVSTKVKRSLHCCTALLAVTSSIACPVYSQQPSQKPTSIRASEFMNMLGVNVHLNEGSYKDTRAIADALTFIGMSHVRGSCQSPEETAAWKDLNIKFTQKHPAGVRADVLVTGYLNAPNVSLLSQEKLIPEIAPLIETIEGPNEINNRYVGNGTHGPGDFLDKTADFAANSSRWASNLYRWKRTVPSLASVGLIAPSIASGDPADYAALPNISPSVDFGNIHFYAGNGRQPSNFGGGNFAAVFHWYQAAATPTKLVTITECGQTTASKPGQGGCDEPTQAKYILNQAFDAAAIGAHRAYFYQLMDDTSDGDPTGSGGAESHFGLFDYRWRPKAAAIALKNLTTILADRPTAFKLDPLEYSVLRLTASGEAGNTLTINKSDGSTIIAVWNEPQIWDSKANTPITNVRDAVIVMFHQSVSFTVFDPLVGTNPVAVGHGQFATITLSGSPLMIEVRPISLHAKKR